MIELRDYQIAILDKLRTGFAEGHRAQMLYCPTGGGKTEMGISLMKAASDKYNRSAMVLDRIVLCNQTSERLDKYSIDHGVLQSGHWRHRPYERIQVCSAQTLEKRGSLPDMKLLLIDEAHQTRAQTIEFIKNNTGIKVVGLSATPFTKGLGSIYTNVVSAITTQQLVEQGKLAPLRVYVGKEIDMNGAKKVAGEWSSKEAETRGIKITGDIVAEWVKKTHEVFGAPRKTIVFAAGVSHAADLARQFGEAGYNFVSLSYRDDDDFKAEAIREFSKSDTSIHGLIATDILTKGFDVPDVMIGVSARPFSKSLASHIQQLGRVMRSSPGKEFALWLCHSGNYLGFQEAWEDVYANGIDKMDEGKEKPRKEPSQQERERAVCPRCGTVWLGRRDDCAACGFVRPRLSEVIATPGELRELQPGSNTADKELKQRWYSELLSVAHERGYSDGWVAHKYKEKFTVWPRGLDSVEVPVSAEVARWIKSRQIAWAKARKAA